MKRLLPKVCLLLALIALAMLPLPVSADQHMKASGKIVFDQGSTILNVTVIGGYTVVTDKLTGDIIGDMESSNFIFIRTLIIHSNGDFDVTGEITGEATMFGRTGGFTQRITATGSLIPSPGFVQGEFVLLGGTGGLVGLHGQGTFSGIPGQASDYSGKIYFDTK